MAITGITSAGVGSGLDINGIIDAIMGAEKIPLQKMQSKSKTISSQISVTGQLKSLFTDFQTQLTNLKKAVTQNYFTITPSDSNRLAATVDSATASLGTHSIVVSKLASAHQINSDGFTSSTTSTGATGDLNIQVGSNSFQISISNSNNTLEGIRNAINNSSSNTGVQASILKVNNGSSDEYRLVLTSKNTGSAGAITLSDLSGNVAATLNVTHQINPAQNAEFSVNGFSVVRSTNTISDVLQGVTFTLKSSDPSPMTLSVASDNDTRNTSFKSAIQGFVDKFNSVIDYVNKQEANDESGNGGTYRLIRSQLRSVIENPATSAGTYTLLKELGISTKAPEDLTRPTGAVYKSIGKIQLDTTTLDSMLQNNFTDVVNVLTNSTDGYINRMQTVSNNINKFGGTIDLFKTTLTSRQKTIDDRIVREQNRLDNYQENLQKQYARLDSLLGQFKNTNDYLARQFAPKSSSN